MAELKTATETTSTPAVTSPAVQNSVAQKKKSPGLQFRRLFTKPGVSPYDEVEWDLRLAQITDAQGNVIFEQKDVEVPKDWSMTATNIVASKYLHGKIGTPERETGVRQLVARVAETIRDWGMAQGYFRTRRRRRHLPRRTRPHPRSPVRRLQLARLVQRGMRSHRAQLRRPQLALEPADSASRIRRHRIFQAPVLRLLHQLGERFARLHPHSGQDRRHALQVGHQAPARISRPCADPPKRSPAAAPPAARSAS